MESIRRALVQVGKRRGISRDIINLILSYIRVYQQSLLVEFYGYLENNQSATDYYRKSYFMYKVYRFLVYNIHNFYLIRYDPNFRRIAQNSITRMRHETLVAPEYVIEMADRLEQALVNTSTD